jgi:hypothetical protein
MPKTYEQLGIFEASMSPAGIKQAVRYLFSPGAAPQHSPLQGANSSGWLESYMVKRCGREYWYWRWCYRMDAKIHHKYVSSTKLSGVRYLIAEKASIDRVLQFLKSKPR